MIESSEGHRSSNFKQRTTVGVAWSVFGQLAETFVVFLIGVVLARLLRPAEFGIVGMMLVFTSFAVLFADFGFGAALIQRRNATAEQISSVFWINVLVGVLLTALFIAAAPLIASFYNQPRLVQLVRLGSWNF